MLSTAYKQVNLSFKVWKLEQEEIEYSSQLLSDDENENLYPYSPNRSLYHGLRFQQHLETLEQIFQTKKILAGKYIKGYMKYSDNANKGEYISLLGLVSICSNEYKNFIRENISLIISPKCNAILTKQISFYDWDQIKDVETKNLYSYMEGEFFYKVYLSFEFVKAIGVPYNYYKQTKGLKYADLILNNISELIEKYDINLDIVDTSKINQILVHKKKQKVKKL